MTETNRLCILFSLLFASFGSFGQTEIDHWETAVYADDVWSFRLGTSAPPQDWMMPDFDDSSWLSGQGGIGYGDGDDNTEIEPVHSVFLRIDFELIDTSKISMAIFHADYDDAFVAYLNGVEIGRGNIGDPTDILEYNESPPIDQEAVLYTGGLPEAFPLYPYTFDQLVQEGQNTLAIQVNNFLITSSDLSSNFFFSLGITDSSFDYGPTPEWFFEPFLATELPLIQILTNGQEILNDPRIVAQMKIIDNGEGELNYIDNHPTDYNGQVAIEIRGESSQFFEKKNYAFETQTAEGENNNVSLLGMPAENDWILHGPYSDKSLIRNALTFEMGNDVMEYASRTRFCELIINDDYRGVYLLMEKIKQDDARVDIAKLLPEDTEGDELTGGYILEIDRDNPEIEDDGFYSSFPLYAFYTFHDPGFDQLVPDQKAYIQEWIYDFELAMYLSSYESTYQNYLDIESFIDYFLINELTKQIDAFKLSFYMYKEKDSNGGKLHMGPIWDFNLGYSNFDFACDPNPEGWIYPCTAWPFWVEKLMTIEAVQDQMYCRWQQLREDKLETSFLMSRIDSLVTTIGPAADRNFERYDVLGNYVWPNLFISETYDEEVEYMRDWLVQRLFWMDQNMFGSADANCGEILSSDPDQTNTPLRIYPNPFTDKVTFSFNDHSNTDGEILLYSITGEVVLRFSPSVGQSNGFSQLSSGIYFYEYRIDNHPIQQGKLVKQ
jgi:hypothetical protein